MTPLVCVVGPTATGKTALAVALAERLGGEIINADSRQVYRYLDIGTAKPTADEQARVPHHLIDVADPDEQVSLGWFLDLAHAALREIRTRGRVPFLVGGTGQWVRAYLENWDVPRVPPNPELRARLGARLTTDGVQSLYADLMARDPVAAARIDAKNPRRVMRALEIATGGANADIGEPIREPLGSVVVLGIRMARDVLDQRISERVDAMFAAGLVDEVRALLAAGWRSDLPGLSAIGYREVCDVLAGIRTLDNATEEIKRATRRLARSQGGWFRPTDPRIRWLDGGTEAVADALTVIERTGGAARQSV